MHISLFTTWGKFLLCLYSHPVEFEKENAKAREGEINEDCKQRILNVRIPLVIFTVVFWKLGCWQH